MIYLCPKKKMVRTRHVLRESLLMLALTLSLYTCHTAEEGRAFPGAANTEAQEQKVRAIPLSGRLANGWAEVSGLAWFGEHVIILPQYPDRFSSEDDGRIFAVSKHSIQRFLGGHSNAPIKTHEIAFVAPDVKGRIEGFEGYEAIAFKGDRVFMTIESKRRDGMMGYLISGDIVPDLSAIRLDPGTLTEIPPQAHLDNMGEEALLVVKDRVLTLYEANGAHVNPNPSAHVFDPFLRPHGTIPFPRIEYRVTDATATDAEGHFWVMNFFFPGDHDKLNPAPDAWVAKYGAGSSHSRSAAVERLVEFQYTETQIRSTDRAPIQLELNARSRNWEGVVRLDNKGFLLVTDRYPKTILGFVPAP